MKMQSGYKGKNTNNSRGGGRRGNYNRRGNMN